MSRFTRFCLRFVGGYVGSILVLKMLTVDVGLEEFLAVGCTLLLGEVLLRTARKVRFRSERNGATQP